MNPKASPWRKVRASDQHSSSWCCLLLAAGLLAVPRASAAPTFTTQPASLSATVHTSCSITAAASGAQPTAYQWFRNGQTVLYGQQSATLVFPDTEPGDGGSYTLQVTDPTGTTTSAPAVLTVIENPPPTFSNFAPGGGATTVGAPLSITGFFANGEAAQWYKDGQLLPGQDQFDLYIGSLRFSDSGTYVEVAGNGAGQVAGPPVTVEVSQPVSANAWVGCSSYNGVAYFAFGAPAQILRYDMNAGSWLVPVPLPQAPTAILALSEGVYIAFGTSASLYALDLSASQAITSTAFSISQIFSNGTYAYLWGSASSNPSEPYSAAVTRATGQVAATSGPFITQLTGIAGVNSSLAYGWTYSEGSSLQPIRLNPDGSVVPGDEFPVVEKDYPDATSVFVSPEGSTVFADSGGVYGSASLTFETSLGQQYDDLCFLGDGSVVALRGYKLTLYSPSYSEEGIVDLAGAAQAVYGNGSTVYAFSAPASAGGLPVVAATAEAQLAAAPRQPLPALSAAACAALGMVPDDGFAGTDGILYLLSLPTGNILRWSPSQAGYLASIPLTGIPEMVTYSSALNRIYVLYGDSRITQIDLGAAATEAPFATLEYASDYALAADGQLFVRGAFPSGLQLYSQAGVRTSTALTDPTDGSELAWIAGTQEVVYPLDGGFNEASLSGGTIGSFHIVDGNSGPTATFPLRLSADGSLMISGAGEIYSTSSLSAAGNVAVSPVDSAWIGSSVYTITPNVGSTQVDRWGGAAYADTGRAGTAGYPQRAWNLAGDLAVLTSGPYGPQIYAFDAGLDAGVGQQANSAPWMGTPEITVEPEGGIVAAGGSITLSVAAVGSNLSYRWVTSGLAAVGTGPSLVLSNIGVSQAGTYTAVVSSGNLTASSDPVAVYVESPPVITDNPVSSNQLLGGFFQLIALVEGYPAPTVQWYQNGLPIPGANSEAYQVNDVTAASAGTYYMVATNAYGTAATTTATVTVSAHTTAPVITTQPVSASVDTGSAASFFVTVTAVPGPTYQWSHNGSPIAGATSNQYSIASTQASDAGTYAVVVTNALGSATSSPATLTVSSTVAPSIATQPLSQAVAPGAPVTFTVAATGTGPLAYQWAFDGQPIAGATSAGYSIGSAQVSASGSYAVTVTGPDTAVVSQSAVLTVSAATGEPAISSQPAPQTIQAGATVTFTVGSGGTVTTSVAERASSSTTYQWLHNGAAIAGATDSTLVLRNTTAASGGSYSCLVANASGATLSGSAMLTVVNSPNPARLIDISCRAFVGTGPNILIAGFTVGGGGSGALPVLVRSSGPALAQFSVPGLLPDPTLNLYAASNSAAPLEVDAGWAGATVISSTAAAVGAFAWTSPTSHDSAVVQSLGAGGYTAQTVGSSGDTGVALAEVYDATPSGAYVPGISQRLTNISARVPVATGSGILIAGFVIGGSTSETVLIRASGPALTQFGVGGVLPDPKLTLNGASGTDVIATSQGWNGDAQSASVASSVGAFAWPSTSSNDALLLVTLPPGAYTAEISGASGDTGIALVEVYEVP